jgi:hypothetical protein
VSGDATPYIVFANGVVASKPFQPTGWVDKLVIIGKPLRCPLPGVSGRSIACGGPAVFNYAYQLLRTRGANFSASTLRSCPVLPTNTSPSVPDLGPLRRLRRSEALGAGRAQGKMATYRSFPGDSSCTRNERKVRPSPSPCGLHSLTSTACPQRMFQALHLSIRLGVVCCCCTLIRSHGFQYFLHDFC